MTVEDLIKKLQTMNQKTHVVVSHGNVAYMISSNIREGKCDEDGTISDKGKYPTVMIQTFT